MSISLQLLHLRWAGSTVAVLEKQILRQSVWFECCHCKWLLDQKSDWLQMILCCTERLLTVLVRKLCFWAFSSVSLYYIVVLISVRRIWLFLVWSKMLKSLICSADKYLVNFTENQKKISHLSYMKMKFWERQIMYIYLIKRWFRINF